MKKTPINGFAGAPIDIQPTITGNNNDLKFFCLAGLVGDAKLAIF